MALDAMNALHSQLLAGLPLTYDVAVDLYARHGLRKSKEEKDIDFAIAADVERGAITSDERGRDMLYDILKLKTESRFMHAFHLARSWAGLGAKIGAAIGGATGAVGGATVGLSAGPVAAATAAAAATLAGGITAGTAGGAIGFVAGGVYGAIRD